MFGSKVEVLNTRITGLVALLAVASGITVAADGELPTADAVKAALAEREKKAIDAALAPVVSARDAAVATASAFTAGFAAAGVKVGEFKADDFKVAKEGELSPAAAAIKSAVETAITSKATRTIASTGHEAALDIDKTPDSSANAAATPANAEEFMKNYQALQKKDPRAASAYFARHEGKFAVR